MKVIGLLSGGKDSCYNLVQCVAAGHQIVALANLKPLDRNVDELDSQMYQTVGTSAIEFIAEAMDIPLYVGSISGVSSCTDKDYLPTQGDEVEDLYSLLQRVANETGAQAVSVGAILSDYQRVRVESVCSRLNLTSLAYLWKRNQAELLKEMISCQMESILIKVACLGLHSAHLGRTLAEMEPTLMSLEKKFGVHVCGEGGEYETFTLDSPLFKKKLKVLEKKCINVSCDEIAPVSYLQLVDIEVVDKHVPPHLSQQQIIQYHGIEKISPDDYLNDLISINVTESPDPIEEMIPLRMEVCNVSIIQHSIGEGWFDILNIEGRGRKATECMTNCFQSLATHLKDLGLSLTNLIRTHVYIDTMDNYAEINNIYCKHFGINPPVRICVALGSDNLPAGCMVKMSVRGCTDIKEARCLHVQGVSHWAPANIGPYSQGYSLRSKIHVSGQIGLVPGSMTLHPDMPLELDLAFRHVTRVATALHPQVSNNDIWSAVCYIVNPANLHLVNSYWSKKDAEIPVTVQLVSQLPRKANFEWEVVYNAAV